MSVVAFSRQATTAKFLASNTALSQVYTLINSPEKATFSAVISVALDIWENLSLQPLQRQPLKRIFKTFGATDA